MGSGPAGPQGVLENNLVCYLEPSGAVECEQVTHCVPVHLGLIRAGFVSVNAVLLHLTGLPCVSVLSAFRDPLDMGGDQRREG